MDILRAEIAKKRKELEDKNLLTNNKKYFRRGDLDAVKVKIPSNVNSTNSTECSDNTTDTENMIKDNSQNTLPRTEVIRKLRERGQPITLFGESETDSFKRLRRCEILEPEVNKGLRNDFQEAMEQVDQAYLDELLESSKPQEEHKRKDDVYISEEEVTYEDIQKMAEDFQRKGRETDMHIIMTFLQFLVKMWGHQLNSRSGAEKMSTKGKMDGAIYAQTREYLKPLIRKLKKKNLPEDITDSLTDIVKRLLERNYIYASDAYLQMAIGNSPWPIGVTMVGIHARTGREKIFSKNVAHVMNDETQRKYIQALKRLMTKCQEYYPTDPSRCVEYTKK
ncbi:pre-mRNA-splicing factor 18 [Trichogramma pretiosum]|uniref:pre-mRNA-splicing factor 18 n=1 Tax=Trichogramma pretiosum TaxID=7493 RepID=UPI0006C941A0|nr:pre-mRNA-splicing factor 18 [Trichogramma pretiosum]